MIVGRHRGERAELAPEHHPRRRLLLRHAQDPAAAQTRRELGHLSTGNTSGSFNDIFTKRFTFFTARKKRKKKNDDGDVHRPPGCEPVP